VNQKRDEKLINPDFALPMEAGQRIGNKEDALPRKGNQQEEELDAGRQDASENGQQSSENRSK
jgi:hypothetical protein